MAGGRPRRAAGLRQCLAGRLSALCHRFRHPRRPGARDRARRRHVTLYLDSAAGGRPRRARMPRHRDRATRPTWSREVDAALEPAAQPSHRRRAAAAPAAPARRARRTISSSATSTGFVDRLLMDKLDSEIAAIRRAAKLADDGYEVFRAGRARRPRRLRAGRRGRGVLPRQRRRRQFPDHRRRRRRRCAAWRRRAASGSSAATW